MNVKDPDLRAAAVASAIGEPTRARMLYSLMDDRARTATELAVLAGVSPSTASVHLKCLADHNLLKVLAQGKHRYYTLRSGDVAVALEALDVLGGGKEHFSPSTPEGLRLARTCYDHIAGALGVKLHDHFKAAHWLSGDTEYELTREGQKALNAIGVDVESARSRRRRFAFACVDWSERRPHLAGSLGAAVLDLAIRRKWVLPDPDGRALSISRSGRRELSSRFGLEL